MNRPCTVIWPLFTLFVVDAGIQAGHALAKRYKPVQQLQQQLLVSLNKRDERKNERELKWAQMGWQD